MAKNRKKKDDIRFSVSSFFCAMVPHDCAIPSADLTTISCFLFRPRKSCEKRRKRSHTNVSSTLSTRSSTPPAQTPQRSFRGAATGTHLPSPTGSHTRAYTAKQGAFRMGALLLPSERSTRFGNPAWPGFKTANFAAFGSWSETLLKNAESLRSSDALMRVAVPKASRPRWAA